MVIQVAKHSQNGYNHAAAGERNVQQTSEWMLRKRAFQSKFRPLTYVIECFIATLGSAQTRGLSLYSSGAPLPVSSEIATQKSDTV